MSWKKIFPILLVSLFTVFVPQVSARFTDVSASNENYNGIEYVQSQGIVSGYADGTFKPGQPINRAEFVKIVISAFYDRASIDSCIQESSNNISGASFPDVKKEDWFAKYICMTNEGENPVIKGYPDGTFKPSQNITFVEAAKILTHYFRLDLYNGINANAPSGSPWYYAYVRTLDDQFAIPLSIKKFDQNITRGEMAEMIYRLKTVTQDKTSASYDSIRDAAGTDYITITYPEKNAILYEEPFYITGNTPSNCYKIIVEANNPTYNIHDVYTLSTYAFGNTTFKYGVKHAWNNLDVGKNTYIFTAVCDSGNQLTSIDLFYEAGGGVEMGKPVVYLYPEHEQKVFVLPQPEGGVTVSEPALGEGWNVTAKPNGEITDAQGKKWEYLFWEGFSNLVTPKEGFLVAKKDLSAFFEEKLTFLGLNVKERADFKEYWLAQLGDDATYFISFIDQTQLDAHAPLLIEPKPDTLIRIFFDYKKVDAGFAYIEQKLVKGLARTGFTVTEWGGRL